MTRRYISMLLLFVLVIVAAASTETRAEPKLPNPEKALTDPAMERLSGYLFSRRFEEKGFDGVKPVILPSTDPDSKLVRSVVERIAQVVSYDRPDFEFVAKVVKDDKTDNAFCMPGGYIYVYTGLLKTLREMNRGQLDENQLAFVLAHEVAHAVLRHALQKWAAARVFEEGLSYDFEFYSVLMAAGRSREAEADRYGMLYAVRAGYNADAAVAFWDKQVGPGADIPPHQRVSWTDWDHPTNAERARQLREYKAQLIELIALWDEALKSLKAQNFEQAVACLEVLRADFPNLPSIHNNLGFARYQMFMANQSESSRGRQQLSSAYMAQLGVTLRGGDEDATLGLASAEREFKKALALSPGLSNAIEGLGLIALARQEYPRAQELLVRAAALDATSPVMQNNLGVLYDRLGRPSEAAACYQKAMQIRASYAPAIYNLALVHQSQGRSKEAVTLLTRYLALDQSGYWAEQARKQLALLGGVASTRALPTRVERGTAGVSVGDAVDTVVGRMGAPSAKQMSKSGTEMYVYVPRGLVFMVRDGRVCLIAVVSDAADAVQGIKVGMRQQEVERAMGGAPGGRETVDGIEFWAYADRGMAIGLKNNKVYWILIGGS